MSPPTCIDDKILGFTSFTSAIDVMNVFKLIIITITLTGIFCKKKHKAMSSESIENILYYQDCNHKKTTAAPPVLLRGPPPPQPPQECKMCCTMCCGDQCVDSHQVTLGRQAVNQIEPKGVMPVRPDGVPPRERRKKPKNLLPLQPPLPGRRGLGPVAFTRENIKNLISQDEDIRKILKELVRVTMQKVDLMQLMRGGVGAGTARPERATDYSDSENDL